LFLNDTDKNKKKFPQFTTKYHFVNKFSHLIKK
jgi:hypothetical protein